MKKKITLSIVGLITVVAAIVFIDTLVHATVYIPGSGSLPLGIPVAPFNPSASSRSIATGVLTKEVPVTPPDSYPKRLTVPAIGIDAAVQEVGMTTNGAIGTPNNFTDVAWYAYGPIPGKNGNAIIDGHVDNGLGLSGVFKNLSNVKVGDDIYITTYGGAKLHFKVSNTSWYDYKDIPASVVAINSSQSSLELITCGGTWVQTDRTYDKRLVVTATLVQ